MIIAAKYSFVQEFPPDYKDLIFCAEFFDHACIFLEKYPILTTVQ